MTSADALAELLDLDAHDTPICLACLSDVVLTLDSGEVGKINGSISTMAPHLWAQVSSNPCGSPCVERSRTGSSTRPPRSATSMRTGRVAGSSVAVVLWLALQLREHARGDRLKMGFHPWPPV